MPQKLTIADMKNIAIKRGGRCLSKKYTNISSPLEWQCKFGHIWFSSANNVKNGNKWCHVCGGTSKLELNDMHILAKERNGRCLSKEYINIRTKLKWQCDKGHIWFATPNDVKNDNTWCPRCRGTEKHGILKMKEIAKDRGGRCLSKTYKDIFTKLLWECSRGHRWSVAPVGIIHQKQWCPICSSGSGERLCRLFFENIFNKKFPKVRPKWLGAEKTGRPMEIDGFNQELKLGFEYNGSQHYKVKTLFYKTINKRKELEKRRQGDVYKINLAKHRGVNIISVPYWVEPNSMEKFIVSQAKHLGYNVEEKRLKFDRFDINDNEVYERLKQIANLKGGSLLSKSYIDSKTKLKWRCINGHVFYTTPASIINQNSWCFKCSYADRNKKGWITRKNKN